MSQSLNIGLLGFGVVGQGFYEIFTNNRPEGFTIKRIAAKNPGKERSQLDAVIEFEAFHIVDDPNIQVVVEAINDAETAYKLVKKALSNGKHAISANKQMLAKHLPELSKIASHQGVALLFEGAVGGVIPILQNLRNYFGNDRLEQVEGIINGSSNYILTQLSETDNTYAQAVSDAQSKGFAESDPKEDVGGYDAAAKLSLIASLGFQHHLPIENIATFGIENLTVSEIDFAKNLNLKIKQIARIDRQDNKVSAYVLPSFVAAENPLFHIKNEFNAVRISGNNSNEQLLSGKGAGKLPTGFAVYNDLLKIKTPQSPITTNDSIGTHNPLITTYVRLGAYDLDLKSFGFEILEELGEGTFLCEIALANLNSFGKAALSSSALVIEASELRKRGVAKLHDLVVAEKN